MTRRGLGTTTWWRWLVRWGRATIAVVATAAASTGIAGDFEPPDVHEVEAQPQNYLDQTVRLTGRFASWGGGHLRLAGSKIDFRLEPDAGKIRDGMTHLELSGRLVHHERGLGFRVASLIPLAAETERFARRHATLAAPNYPGLYDLSRWARVRGRWYDDRELARLAWTNYREAFSWEEDEAARTHDAHRLLALAARGEFLGLEPPEVNRIRHRALWLLVDRLEPQDAAGRNALARQIRALLPGTETPLDKKYEELVRSYLADPLQSYAMLSPDERKVANRGLWAQLVAQALAIEADAEGADLMTLARRSHELVPDHAALARRLKVESWQRRTAEPAKLTRTALLEARDALVALGLPERAKALVSQWLAERRTRLAAGDVEERIVLARDFQELVGDDDMSATLYRQALALAPGLAEAESGLDQLGYTNVAGLWKRTADLLNPPNEQAADAVEIRPGDSEKAVLASFRKPDRIARTAGDGWIVEQWIYDGPPPLFIYLRRSTATGQAVVARLYAP